MRGTVFEYDSFDALQRELGGSECDLELPCCASVNDGEWLLVTFKVGSQSTAFAGCVCKLDKDACLSFEARDWGALQEFAEGNGPPSQRPQPTHRSDPITLTPPPDCSVLVVDPDPDTQSVVAAVLRAKGFQVVAVASAEQALERLKTLPVRLLLVDWNLPGISGLELCRLLRGDQDLKDTPVVFLTAHSSHADLLSAFDAGADDFVTKPFRAHELATRILGLVERRWGKLKCAG